MVDEAKESGAVNVDALMDAELDRLEVEKDNSGQSSSADDQTADESVKTPEGNEDPDLAKKEPEEKETEEKAEEEIPKEFHKHAAWQKLLTRAKTAEAKAKEVEAKAQELEKRGVLDDDTKTLLTEFKSFTTSKQYLEDKLKAEGFRDDVVQKKLEDAGFKNDNINELEIATRALGLDHTKLTEQDKTDISNLAKIADALMMTRLKSILPETLNPIKQKFSEMTQREQGQKVYDSFVTKVQADNLLDFTKDLAPEITKFLDENESKGITQADVQKFMENLYHQKLVLYNKAKGRKEERQKTVQGNKPGSEGGRFGHGAPAKSGDINKDADALLDHLGVR
jgi:hypothetical protein